jgi:hypothetical protein
MKAFWKSFSFILITSAFIIVFGCGGDKSEKPAITKFKSSEEAAKYLSGNMGGRVAMVGSSSLAKEIAIEQEFPEGETSPNKEMSPKIVKNFMKKTLQPLIKGSPRIVQKQFDIEDAFLGACPEGPRCVEGKVERFNCQSGHQSESKDGQETLKFWLTLDVAVSNCKEEFDEGDYIITNGYFKAKIEFSATRQIGAKQGETKTQPEIRKYKFKTEIDGDLTTSESHGTMHSKIRIRPSQFKIEGDVETFTDLEKSTEYTISTWVVSGKLLAEDLIANKREEYSFQDFKVKQEEKWTFVNEFSSSEGDIKIISGSQPPEQISPPEMKMEISGVYSVETSPDSCIEGIFQYETVEPLKPSYDESACPVASGKIKVNNSILEFSQDKVIVSVDGERKIYSCEEFFNLCQYESIITECGAASISGGVINLILILIISAFIFFVTRGKFVRFSERKK